jgi:HAE1 family hydrophobic/amphiphilic exporter-1
MLSSRFVRFIPPEERTRTRTGRLFERMGRAYDRLDHGYHRVLAVALRNPWKTLGVAAAVFVISLSATTVMGTEFVPVEDRGEFQAIVELPPGTSFEESVATTARVEREISAIPEVTQVFSTVGVNGQVRASNLRVKTTKKDTRERGIDEIKAQVRSMLADIPFVDGKVADPEFMQGAPYEPPINVFVRGDDLPTLQRVRARFRPRSGSCQVRSTSAATS